MQQTVKTRLIVPFIRYTEHQMAGCSRMTKVPLALVCRTVFHLTIYHSSSVCSVSDFSSSQWRDLIFQFIPSQCCLVCCGSVNICLRHRDEAGLCLHSVQLSGFDEDAINFGFYLSSAENCNRWCHWVLILPYQSHACWAESCSESH